MTNSREQNESTQSCFRQDLLKMSEKKSISPLLVIQFGYIPSPVLSRNKKPLPYSSEVCLTRELIECRKFLKYHMVKTPVCELLVVRLSLLPSCCVWIPITQQVKSSCSAAGNLSCCNQESRTEFTCLLQKPFQSFRPVRVVLSTKLLSLCQAGIQT